ncbi:membrane protein [Gordonia phage Flapper]|uniref:Membrane protein n=1 Tax=Gordonia phage Flapper TaxID=2079415 RepID=A0A2L1IXA3_9CAUD|nr:holin [Gordonia phage Flapper]AVD99798.1 membrane protein [Gordonia phage Flapper]
MTLPNVPDVPSSVVIDELRATLERQPWYKRFANTVTTAVGALALIAWLLTSNGIGIDPAIVTAVGSALGVLTTLGVLKTPNGVTPRGVATVQVAAVSAGRHRQE